MSVLVGALVAFVLAVGWMAIPWQRLARRPKRQPAAEPVRSFMPRFVPDVGDLVVYGDGFRVVLEDGATEVSSLQKFGNGSTQVWLKRKAEA